MRVYDRFSTFGVGSPTPAFIVTTTGHRSCRQED
jgi:hypothetical protein